MSHKFTVKLTCPAGEAIDKARCAIGDAGSLIGDTSTGSFSGSGVAGSYHIVGDEATITITKKPFIAPMSLIESKVREFFS